jgi:hypothetical protein
MLISSVESKRSGDFYRMTARVEWEDCDNPAREIYLETHAANSSGEPEVRADAFVTAAVMPALVAGERRVFTRAPVCPELMDNLRTATQIMDTWMKCKRSAPLAISSTNPVCMTTTSNRTAASMLSGGIDSLAVIVNNTRNVPPDHPLSIKRCIFVNGFDVGGFHEDPSGEVFVRIAASLEEILKPLDIRLTTVRTNLIELNKNEKFWAHAHHGAGCSSVGHFLGSDVHTLFIGSSFRADRLEPWGSHLSLDPYFSSGATRIIHKGSESNRFEKIRAVCENAEFRRRVAVCWESQSAFESGALNCGVCAKCVRTKIAYRALGILDETAPFADLSIDPDSVRRTPLKSPLAASFFEELIEPLAEAGETELLEAVLHALKKYRLRRLRSSVGYESVRRYAKEKGRGVIGFSKRLGS